MEQIVPAQSVLNADGDEGMSVLDLSHVAKKQNFLSRRRSNGEKPC